MITLSFGSHYAASQTSNIALAIQARTPSIRLVSSPQPNGLRRRVLTELATAIAPKRSHIHLLVYDPSCLQEKSAHLDGATNVLKLLHGLGWPWFISQFWDIREVADVKPYQVNGAVNPSLITMSHACRS